MYAKVIEERKTIIIDYDFTIYDSVDPSATFRDKKKNLMIKKIGGVLSQPAVEPLILFSGGYVITE